MQDLQAMFTLGEIQDKVMGKIEKGHFCKACMYVLMFIIFYCAHMLIY